MPVGKRVSPSLSRLRLIMLSRRSRKPWGKVSLRAQRCRFGYMICHIGYRISPLRAKDYDSKSKKALSAVVLVGHIGCSISHELGIRYDKKGNLVALATVVVVHLRAVEVATGSHSALGLLGQLRQPPPKYFLEQGLPVSLGQPKHPPAVSNQMPLQPMMSLHVMQPHAQHAQKMRGREALPSHFQEVHRLAEVMHWCLNALPRRKALESYFQVVHRLADVYHWSLNASLAPAPKTPALARLQDMTGTQPASVPMDWC